MGTITLGGADGLRDETKFNLRGRSDAALSDTRLNRWINAAYRHMCLPNVHPFREMQAVYDFQLVLNQSEYSISEATVLSKVVGTRSAHLIRSTVITDTAEKRQLRPRNIRWLDRRTLITGPEPSIYSIEGENIYIHPVPASSAVGFWVRMRYWQEPTALVDDTDVTALASYYDEVLILGAQMFAERALGYGDRAEATKQNYVGLLNEGPEQEQVEGEDWNFQVDVDPNNQHGDML